MVAMCLSYACRSITRFGDLPNELSAKEGVPAGKANENLCFSVAGALVGLAGHSYTPEV